MNRAFHWLKVGIEVVQGWCLVAIVGLVLSSIVLRNFFDIGLVWIFEATGFFMVVMVFLGAPRNLIDNTEINVTTFVEPLPKQLKLVLWCFHRTVVLLTSFVFVYFFVIHASQFGRLSSPALGIPNVIFYASVAIGPAISVVVALWRFAELFKGRVDYERL